MSAAPLRRRLTGFLLIPTIAALSPLVVLPLVSRSAGPSGWASAIAGESLAGLFIVMPSGALAVITGLALIGPLTGALGAVGERPAHARLVEEMRCRAFTGRSRLLAHDRSIEKIKMQRPETV